MEQFDDVEQYFNEMEELQSYVLQVVSDENQNEIVFQDFSDYIKKMSINTNKHKFKALLNLISKLSINYHRSNTFFSKIEKVLLLLREDITNFFPNDEIFFIFHKNKRILLFLFQEQIITADAFIASVFIRDKYKTMNYPQYFFNEIKSFLNDDYQQEIFKSNTIYYNDSESFETKRKIGENDSYICTLIRDDNINEFISYVNRENVNLSSEIEQSIFETNMFLLKRKPKLIEYSAFFGSINIFKYLLLSKADYTEDLFLYAIHSNNSELIHCLEDNDIKPYNNKCFFCYNESMICFNTELADYFDNNYELESFKTFNFLKHYNLSCFSKKYPIFDLCKYDHFIPVKIILENSDFEDIHNKSLLIIAAEKGNLEIVQLLLEYEDINVNLKTIFTIQHNSRKEETTALTSAIKNNFSKISQILLMREGIDVNDKLVLKKHRVRVKRIERTPLFLAVSNGNAEIVRQLLEKPQINVNLKSTIDYPRRHDEKTPLMKAIEIKNTEIVQLLLNHPNIDVSIKLFENKIYCETKILKTIFYLAVEVGKIETVELLLNNEEIDVNEFSILLDENVKAKKTPLCLAVEKNYEEIVKLLLKQPRIRVNEKSKWTEKATNKKKVKKQKSPLQVAIENNNVNMVNILLDCPEINLNNTGNTFVENKNNVRFFIFIALVICIMIALINSSLNDDKILSYFCQLALLIMAIISFQSFQSNFKLYIIHSISKYKFFT